MKDLEQIREECIELVKTRAYVSAGTSIVPIPFFDMVADAGQLTLLLPEISERFGLAEGKTSVYDAETKTINWGAARDLVEDFAKIVLTRSAVRDAVQSVAGRLVTKQFAKFIPFSGQAVAAGIGYTVFKKVAEEHINECYQQAKEARYATV